MRRSTARQPLPVELESGTKVMRDTQERSRDPLSPAARSALMAKVRGKNTRPEMLVRKLLHKHGYRYRLHRQDLPGWPDIVFPSRRAVVFVHGCFWHRHPGCVKTTMPTARHAFWREKFRTNVERDRRVLSELSQAGWKTMVVWECETSRPPRLLKRLQHFLEREFRSRGNRRC